MLDNIFDINSFNIIQDDNYYYFFRALNMADNNDLDKGIIVNNDEIERIRTNLERYSDDPKYSENDTISLEQIVDHIKIHQRKDTNCISLTSNANTALTYGRGNYKDKYVMIRVPKSEMSDKVYQAGLYMINEVNNYINNLVNNRLLDDYDTQKYYIDAIDSATTQEELDIIKNTLPKKYTDNNENENEYFENGLDFIFTKSKNFQSLNEQQNLIKNKIVMKLDIINKQILPKISNKFLIQTIGLAFSSLELIHYKEIPKSKIIDISKELVDIFGLLQQLPKDTPYLNEVMESLISRIDRIIINGEYKYKDYDIATKELTLDKIYEITNGNIDYKTASDIYKKAFYIAKSKLRCNDSVNLLNRILYNNPKYNALLNYINKNCYGIEPSITTRLSNNLLKVSESVSLDISNNEKDLVDFITNLSNNELHNIMNNPETTLRFLISNFIEKKYDDKVSKEDWYANSIIDMLDLSKFDIQFNLSISQRQDIINALKKHNFMDTYNSLKEQGVSEKDISHALFTNLIKNKGIVDLKETFTLQELEEFIGYNTIKGTTLELRNYQRDALNSIDRIFKDKQFASVILPTGAGKSYVALAEMYKHKDEKMLYLAPNVEILHQLKRLIKKLYNPEEHLGDKDNDIIKRVFPNLTLTTYQYLGESNAEEIINNNYDLIVFDELHRTGANMWKNSVENLLNNQRNNTKILGITATPERDVDLKDMTDHWAQKYGYTEEEIIKGKHLAYNMDIVTAIKLGIIANPKIVNCEYSLISDGSLDDLKLSIDLISDMDKKNEETLKYEKLRRQVENSKGIEQILHENLSKDSKFVVFLPITKKDEEEYEDLDGNVVDKTTAERIIKDYQTLVKQYIFSYKYINENPRIKELYNKVINNIELTQEENNYLLTEKDNILLLDKINIQGKSPALNTETNIIGDTLINYLKLERLPREQLTKGLSIKTKDELDVYSMLGSYSDKKNQRELGNFSEKNNNKPKLMFVMNKLNEGVHASGVNGIIWLRPLDANSRILYLQQLGRCITSLKPGKKVNDSDRPLVIDLVNNTLNVDLNKGETKEERDLNNLLIIEDWIKDNKRDPLITSQDKEEYSLANMLKHIFDRYNQYVENEPLLEDKNVKTKLIIKEIIKEGSNIDLWNKTFNEVEIDPITKQQKSLYKEDDSNTLFEINSVLRDFVELNDEINSLNTVWMKNYELAKTYYEHYGNLEIRQDFKTLDGINPTEDENGINLGHWISTQRLAYKGKGESKITEEQIELLNKIGMIWTVNKYTWYSCYELAKTYYEHYGNLEIPLRFKTFDGINETKDENGINLGQWISTQRKAYKGKGKSKITEEQIELLNKIGMRWVSFDKENIKKEVFDIYYLVKDLINNYNLDRFNEIYDKINIIINKNKLSIDIKDLLVFIKTENNLKDNYSYEKYISSLKENNIDQAILYELLNNYFQTITNNYNKLR